MVKLSDINWPVTNHLNFNIQVRFLRDMNIFFFLKMKRQGSEHLPFIR